MHGNPITDQHNLSTGHQQGKWSVLLLERGKYLEARNRYGDKADFKTEERAREFATTFIGAQVVEFHTEEWENLLAS